MTSSSLITSLDCQLILADDGERRFQTRSAKRENAITIASLYRGIEQFSYDYESILLACFFSGGGGGGVRHKISHLNFVLKFIVDRVPHKREIQRHIKETQPKKTEFIVDFL